jgi:hypothetical protein
VHSIDCHCVSGEDAVVDSNQNLEDAALRGEITTLNKFFGRTAVKQIAWCFHPATSFAFIAEDFQSARPDRVGIGVGELFRQLFSRCWCGPVQTPRNSRLPEKHLTCTERAAWPFERLLDGPLDVIRVPPMPAYVTDHATSFYLHFAGNARKSLNGIGQVDAGAIAAVFRIGTESVVHSHNSSGARNRQLRSGA